MDNLFSLIPFTLRNLLPQRLYKRFLDKNTTVLAHLDLIKCKNKVRNLIVICFHLINSLVSLQLVHNTFHFLCGDKFFQTDEKTSSFFYCLVQNEIPGYYLIVQYYVEIILHIVIANDRLFDLDWEIFRELILMWEFAFDCVTIHFLKQIQSFHSSTTEASATGFFFPTVITISVTENLTEIHRNLFIANRLLLWN